MGGRDDPALAAARANAEPVVRAEPAITLATPDVAVVGTGDVTIAVGSAPNELIAAAVEVLGTELGREPVRVAADHGVYPTDPTVLTGIVTGPGTTRSAAAGNRGPTAHVRGSSSHSR